MPSRPSAAMTVTSPARGNTNSTGRPRWSGCTRRGSPNAARRPSCASGAASSSVTWAGASPARTTLACVTPSSAGRSTITFGPMSRDSPPSRASTSSALTPSAASAATRSRRASITGSMPTHPCGGAEPAELLADGGAGLPRVLLVHVVAVGGVEGAAQLAQGCLHRGQVAQPLGGVVGGPVVVDALPGLVDLRERVPDGGQVLDHELVDAGLALHLGGLPEVLADELAARVRGLPARDVGGDRGPGRSELRRGHGVRRVARLVGLVAPAVDDPLVLGVGADRDLLPALGLVPHVRVVLAGLHRLGGGGPGDVVGDRHVVRDLLGHVRALLLALRGADA